MYFKENPDEYIWIGFENQCYYENRKQILYVLKFLILILMSLQNSITFNLYSLQYSMT